MGRLHALFVLAWGLLRSLTGPAVRGPAGLAEFRRSYAADRLPPLRPSERQLLPQLQRLHRVRAVRRRRGRGDRPLGRTLRGRHGPDAVQLAQHARLRRCGTVLRGGGRRAARGARGALPGARTDARARRVRPFQGRGDVFAVRERSVRAGAVRHAASIATLLAALGCGAHTPGAGGSYDGARALATRSTGDGRPPLAVIAREGDAKGAVAVAVTTAGIAPERGALAGVALAALVEARLAARGVEVSAVGRLGRMAPARARRLARGHGSRRRRRSHRAPDARDARRGRPRGGGAQGRRSRAATLARPGPRRRGPLHRRGLRGGRCRRAAGGRARGLASRRARSRPRGHRHRGERRSRRRRGADAQARPGLAPRGARGPHPVGRLRAATVVYGATGEVEAGGSAHRGHGANDRAGARRGGGARSGRSSRAARLAPGGARRARARALGHRDRARRRRLRRCGDRPVGARPRVRRADPHRHGRRARAPGARRRDCRRHRSRGPRPRADRARRRPPRRGRASRVVVARGPARRARPTRSPRMAIAVGLAAPRDASTAVRSGRCDPGGDRPRDPRLARAGRRGAHVRRARSGRGVGAPGLAMRRRGPNPPATRGSGPPWRWRLPRRPRRARAMRGSSPSSGSTGSASSSTGLRAPGESPQAHARRLADSTARAFAADAIEPRRAAQARIALLAHAGETESRALGTLASALAPSHPSWIAPQGTLFGLARHLRRVGRRAGSGRARGTPARGRPRQRRRRAGRRRGARRRPLDRAPSGRSARLPGDRRGRARRGPARTRSTCPPARPPRCSSACRCRPRTTTARATAVVARRSARRRRRSPRARARRPTRRRRPCGRRAPPSRGHGAPRCWERRRPRPSSFASSDPTRRIDAAVAQAARPARSTAPGRPARRGSRARGRRDRARAAGGVAGPPGARHRPLARRAAPPRPVARRPSRLRRRARSATKRFVIVAARPSSRLPPDKTSTR